MRRVLPLLLLLSASPAFAQTVQSTGAQAPQGASTGGVNEAGERLICRRIESSANRTSARRVCLTAEQWRAYARTNSMN